MGDDHPIEIKVKIIAKKAREEAIKTVPTASKVKTISQNHIQPQLLFKERIRKKEIP